MKESILPCTSGLFIAISQISLRPLTFSNEDAWGDVGDCSGEVSGEEEGDSEVLILVVRVRKMGILAVMLRRSVESLLMLLADDSSVVYISMSCMQATINSPKRINERNAGIRYSFQHSAGGAHDL